MGKPACQINTMAVCRLVWLNEQDSSIGFNELMPGSFLEERGKCMDANVMDAVTLVMLAVGLAMDAFAVSITDGLCYENFHRKEALITSGAFGLFRESCR